MKFNPPASFTTYTMIQAEFFNLNDGQSWGVGHYVFKKRNIWEAAGIGSLPPPSKRSLTLTLGKFDKCLILYQLFAILNVFSSSVYNHRLEPWKCSLPIYRFWKNKKNCFNIMKRRVRGISQASDASYHLNHIAFSPRLRLEISNLTWIHGSAGYHARRDLRRFKDLTKARLVVLKKVLDCHARSSEMR